MTPPAGIESEGRGSGARWSLAPQVKTRPAEVAATQRWPAARTRRTVSSGRSAEAKATICGDRAKATGKAAPLSPCTPQPQKSTSPRAQSASVCAAPQLTATTSLGSCTRRCGTRQSLLGTVAHCPWKRSDSRGYDFVAPEAEDVSLRVDGDGEVVAGSDVEDAVLAQRGDAHGVVARAAVAEPELPVAVVAPGEERAARVDGERVAAAAGDAEDVGAQQRDADLA